MEKCTVRSERQVCDQMIAMIFLARQSETAALQMLTLLQMTSEGHCVVLEKKFKLRIIVFAILMNNTFFFSVTE